MTLDVRPCSLKLANELVTRMHRHHKSVLGHLFSLAVYRGEELAGVVIVGRPVARGLQDGRTAEVTRCCTDGSKNACSKLYGAAWRVAREMGYRRMFTYTLSSEEGVTLRAAGWKRDGEVKGRSWSCETRPRTDKHPTTDKVRWLVSAHGGKGNG